MDVVLRVSPVPFDAVPSPPAFSPFGELGHFLNQPPEMQRQTGCYWYPSEQDKEPVTENRLSALLAVAQDEGLIAEEEEEERALQEILQQQQQEIWQETFEEEELDHTKLDLLLAAAFSEESQEALQDSKEGKEVAMEEGQEKGPSIDMGGAQQEMLMEDAPEEGVQQEEGGYEHEDYGYEDDAPMAIVVDDSGDEVEIVGTWDADGREVIYCL